MKEHVDGAIGALDEVLAEQADQPGLAGDAERATSILVVDDHSEFRAILKQILVLETGLVVTGEAEDGKAAVEWVRERQPDVVIMDVAMPRLDGLEATRLIKDMRPETKVLILTIHTDDVYRERARASGADAFIAKRDIITVLTPTLRRLLAGR